MNGVINANERLTSTQFAAPLKAKYPAYADLTNEQLVTMTLHKYPQYSAYIRADSFIPDPPDVVNAVNRTNRSRAVLSALMLWLLPPIAAYGLGHGVVWVYRGFRAPKLNA